MIDSILTAAGFKLNETYRRSRFVTPPAGAYVVYTDDVSTDGPDGVNRIFTHNYTVELYTPTPDDTAEAAIEKALDDAGIRWEKQDRYWLQDEQLYQTIYEFLHIKKR